MDWVRSGHESLLPSPGCRWLSPDSLIALSCPGTSAILTCPLGQLSAHTYAL